MLEAIAPEALERTFDLMSAQLPGLDAPRRAQLEAGKAAYKVHMLRTMLLGLIPTCDHLFTLFIERLRRRLVASGSKKRSRCWLQWRATKPQSFLCCSRRYSNTWHKAEQQRRSNNSSSRPKPPVLLRQLRLRDRPPQHLRRPHHHLLKHRLRCRQARSCHLG
jgi:hypothetical protein